MIPHIAPLPCRSASVFVAIGSAVLGGRFLLRRMSLGRCSLRFAVLQQPARAAAAARLV